MSRKDIHRDGEATRFSSDNQPEGRGRPLGSLNRSTILRKWLEVKRDVTSPNNETEAGTVEDAVALALLSKACKEDVAAIREVYDSVYGKLKEPQSLDADVHVLIEHVRHNSNKD